MKKIILLMMCVSALFIGLNSCKTTQKKAETEKSAKVETEKPAIASTGDNSQLVGKRWTLVELNGKPVNGKQEAFFVFDADNKVSGNLGCNGFSGMYELQSGNRIKFSQLVNTLKMCLESMETENELKRVLGIADNYYVDNNSLILNRARMAPLARFAVLVQ